MKKLLRLLLATALVFTLSLPALAWEELDPPIWQALQFGSREEYLSGTEMSAEDYVAQSDWMRDYLAAHPAEVAAFDADDYYDTVLFGSHTPAFPKQTFFDQQLPGYTEADFKAQMKDDWLDDLWRNHREDIHRDALVALYPEDFAAFDADAWFAGYFGGTLGLTKAAYMEQEHRSGEDAFRRSMFAESVDGTHTMGHWGVAVNGTPVKFYPRGEIYPIQFSQDILWVPARPVAEALGFAVSYDTAAGTVTFRREDRIAVFTVGSTDYTVDGVTATLGEDPAQVESGRIYLPIPQLAQALDCAWRWNEAHRAVFLQSNDKD